MWKAVVGVAVGSVLLAVPVACVLVAALPSAHAATPSDTAFCTAQAALIDEHIVPLVKPLGSPGTGPQAVGAIVVTLKLGEAPCLFPLGETVLGSGQPPDQDTIFELASVTKVFTTAILALRAASQTIDVNDPVAPYLPQYYRLRPGEAGVTFQQLATFTGGFFWTDPPDYHGQPYNRQAFVKAVNGLVPQDPVAGESHLPTVNFYSNSSIGLLGQVLMGIDAGSRTDVVKPERFSDWIEANITGPLGMTHTSVAPDGAWAPGYAFVHGEYVRTAPFPWVPWGPAGALRSNAADMLRFLTANLCAYDAADLACSGLPADILAALAAAQTPQAYTPAGTLADPAIYVVDTETGVPGPHVQGYAWVYVPPPVPNPDSVTPIIWKDGAHPGFSSWIGFNPDKAYGLVLLMNTGGVAPVSAGLAVIKATP